MRLAEVEHLRGTPGRSLLLFLTDRCPVGCAHCSVDSRRDSPTIRDFTLFAEILAALCAIPHVRLIGISGGEPFVERRGLTLAVRELSAADKAVALYTSGVWARRRVAPWVSEVIRKAACVFLSTDAFHSAAITDYEFARAATEVARCGVWLIVQVLAIPEMIEKARDLLRAAFGDSYGDYGELNTVPPLPYGRGAATFARGIARPGEQFRACGALTAPVVRYDGRVAACCNEQVIMGLGPDRLRHDTKSGAQLRVALGRFRTDPLLTAMRVGGPALLTRHPRFSALARQEVGSICEVCWRIQGLSAPVGQERDPMLVALSVMAAAQGSSRGPKS